MSKLQDTQAYQYNQDGYIILRNHIPDFVIDKVRNDINQVFSQQRRRHGIDKNNPNGLFELFKLNPDAIIGCGKAIQNLPSVYSLMVSYQIMDAVRSFINLPVISTKPVVFFHHPKLAEREVYYKIPPHQDFASIQASSNGVVAWLPLCNCLNDDTGPLEVIPKSHIDGARWDKYENSFGLVSNTKDSDFVKLNCKVGDLILFNVLTVHRSGDNISDNIRYSANFRYADLADTRWIERDYYSPYQYKSVVTKEYRP